MTLGNNLQLASRYHSHTLTAPRPLMGNRAHELEARAIGASAGTILGVMPDYTLKSLTRRSVPHFCALGSDWRTWQLLSIR